jgi:hypothetical protein
VALNLYRFASGTLAARFHRKRTGATAWDDARASFAVIEALGRWSGRPAPAASVVPDPPTTPARITIADTRATPGSSRVRVWATMRSRATTGALTPAPR